MNTHSHDEPTSILVAIDGAATGWEALRWAATEASARDCPLRIVHVFNWPPHTWNPYGYVLVSQWSLEAHDAALALVGYASDRARQIAPGIQITTQIEAGLVWERILHARQPDALLVIGRRRSLGWLRPTPWSVSWQVARRSTAPVVLVGVAPETPLAAPSAGRVVVVLGNLAGSDAVDFALRTARRWNVGVTAVVAGATLSPEIEEAVLERANDFPDVHVRRRVSFDRHGPALTEELRSAALVVVGGRRRGRLHSAFVGSVDGEVTRETDGPIAFVRAKTHRSKPRHPLQEPG